MKHLKRIFEELEENLIYNWVSIPYPEEINNKLNIERLQNILINGIKFKSNDDLNSSSKYPYVVSTTRNPSWRWGGGVIRVSFDRTELSNFFKISPFSYHGFVEWEERIFSKVFTYIKPRFIIKIECSKEWYNIIKSLDNPNNIIIELNNWKRVDAYGGRYILPHKDKRYNT
jgi:hypothetical protein